MYTTAKLLSLRGRKLEERPDPVCSDYCLNHAVLQWLVIFWHQVIGPSTGLSSASANLNPVWQSEEALNKYLKFETEDIPEHRGIFPVMFNIRALQHTCVSFSHCFWAIVQVR